MLDIAIAAALCAVGVAIVLRPEYGAVILVLMVVFVEDAPNGRGWLNFQQIYTGPIGLPAVRAPDLLIALVAVGLLVNLRVGRGKWPSLMTGVTVACAAGAAWGLFIGLDSDAPLPALAAAARPVLYIVLLPIIFYCCAPRLFSGTGWRRPVVSVVGLKAAIGLAGLGAGGSARLEDGTSITFLQAPALVLMLFLCLWLLADALLVARPSWSQSFAGLLAVAAFLLSYRRGLWLGGIAALVVLLSASALIATGPSRRRVMVVVTVAALAIGTATTASITSSWGLGQSVAARASSVSVSSLTASRFSRYRLDEQRNIREQLRDAPIAGIGFGAEWVQRYPLSLSFPGQRSYSHNAFTGAWLRMGLLGPVAYLVLMATGILGGLRQFARAMELGRRGVGAASLGIAASFVAVVLADLTASYSLAEVRFSVVLSAALATLCLLARELREARPAA